ncbi:hypothetical protein MOQ_001207 [Trypanosoma cruzi marinkellei]|uniref:FHA domain-containing protein n=1 Tax=Trypanosoma cruzi marinkellei TaxID=85056 RepID=K2PBZ7_TRYCR|nr:hypothetical protein MOQ_001207 [Trypanosoma cruzi marinkellei]
MWVVYFKGEACFWLVGGESYTVGKKDCQIIIKDDASISRKHLRIDVGEISAEDEQRTDGRVHAEDEEVTPAQMILTDMSKYGTGVSPSSPCSNGIRREATDLITRELQLCRSHGSANDDAEAGTLLSQSTQKLKKDEPFYVPCDNASWRDFSINLGTHGARLRLRWTPMRVLTLALEEEQRAKLNACLRRCGAHVVTDYYRADYFVTSLLTPTPVTIAMLCRAVDIVTPAFFEALRNRHGPHVPLPDPRAYTPPLAEFWSTLWDDGTEDKSGGEIHPQTHSFVDGSEGLRLLYPPQRQDRQRLFASLTFVTVQRSLYEEVRKFLPCAQGRVLLDESLLQSSNDYHYERVILSFYTEHRRHVVLYNSQERLPLLDFVPVIREQLGLCCVEYVDMIKSIVRATPLILTPFPENPMPRLPRANKKEEITVTARKVTAGAKRPHAPASPGGRRTDLNPLFLESPSDGEVGAADVYADCRTGKKTKKEDQMDGWVTRELTAYPDAEDLRLQDPPPLPSYPCFQAYGSSGGDGLTGMSSAVVPSGGKCFRKQKLAVGGETVEMERLTSNLPGNTVLSTTRAIDADDIIPVTVENSAMRSSELRFNAFDATAHHHQLLNRTATARRRVGRRGVAHEVPATVTAAGMAAPGGGMVATPTNMGSRKRTGGTPVNIFDVEALF